jgi:hypothetical protein
MEGVVVLLLRTCGAPLRVATFFKSLLPRGERIYKEKSRTQQEASLLSKGKTGWLAVLFIYKMGLGSCRCLAQIAVIILPFPRRRQQVQWQKMQSQLHKREIRKILPVFAGFNAWQAEREVGCAWDLYK